jgi:hypothetical protein
VPELGTLGSVRGALSIERPYRDPLHLRIRIREDSQPGAAGFEPLHLRIEIYHDSQPGGQDSNLRISNCSAEAALFNKVSGVRPTTLSHDEVQQI